MKKRTLIAACLLAAMSANAQSQVSGIDKKNMNLNVKPGTDFYQYAAGGWLKSHPLDAEHTNNGAFTDLYEENQKRIQELILEYASKPQKKGTLEQKIGTFYNMLMDSVRLNREGWEPLKPTLARIAAVKSNKEYQLVTAELDRRGEGTMMFGIGVGADMRNASMNIVAIGQGGLGLGTRDYYLNEQVKAIIADVADSYEDPQEVMDWYFEDRSRLAGPTNLAVEANVVDYVLGKANVTEKALSFEEVMGANA